MKIFYISDPRKTTQYAMMSVLGTWSESPGICPACGDHGQFYIEPLQIEWEYGSDRIGDFSWRHYTCIVVDKVKSFFEENNYECTFGKIEIIGATKGKSRIPHVAYPYVGPNLSWVRPTRRIRLNEKKSNIQVESDCGVCGYKRYKFKREELYIDKKDWNEERMFRIEQLGRASTTFITERSLEHLENQNFTNFHATFAGEITD